MVSLVLRSGDDGDDFEIASLVFSVNEHGVAPAFEKQIHALISAAELFDG